jgi:hypothetical protein
MMNASFQVQQLKSMIYVTQVRVNIPETILQSLNVSD